LQPAAVAFKQEFFGNFGHHSEQGHAQFVGGYIAGDQFEYVIVLLYAVLTNQYTKVSALPGQAQVN